MGLNPRGRGRGRGTKVNFQAKGRRNGGMMGQSPMIRPGPPGMFCPPFGFPPETSFGPPPFFQGPSGFNYGPSRPSFGKFPRKNFKKNITPKRNDRPLPEIDLTKPWVTEEIRYNENLKQELLQIWRKTKNDEDWDKYKTQKLAVQSLYEKAKAEYAASHPDEVAVLENISTIKHYYCETCDKSFRTDDDLILHEDEHEICGRDGCEFTAHPKIIAKHIKMQHLTGLYKRIGKLYAEEDIAKWIEERKKRYPTRKVVEEKKILELEKINRGEKIKNNESKFNDSFRNKNKNGRKKKNFEKRIHKTIKNRRMKKKKKTSVVQNFFEEKTSGFRKGIPAFLGIKSGDEPEAPQTQKKDCDISDEEWETECIRPNISKPLLNGSLSLLATYNSDEENQSEKPNNEEIVVDMSLDEGSGPEEVKTVICKNPLSQENSKKKSSFEKKFSQKKDKQERKKKNYNDYSMEGRNLTLLEKLLKNEIKHERNVILQCVHFIVKNNFFKT